MQRGLYEWSRWKWLLYWMWKWYMRCIHISNPIEHCLYYSEYGDELCFQCEKGYGLYNGQKSCKKIENPIKNCSLSNLMSEAEKCDECENGFVLSYKDNACKIVENCFYLSYQDGKEVCGKCNPGYAVSFEGMNCIQFENCEKLAKGDIKCSECTYYYHPNAEGKCEETPCENYDENDVCTKCFEGYYLNNISICEKFLLKIA